MVRVTPLKAFIQDKKWLNQSQLQTIRWQILDTGATEKHSIMLLGGGLYFIDVFKPFLSLTSSVNVAGTLLSSYYYRVTVHQHSDKDLVSRNGGRTREIRQNKI